VNRSRTALVSVSAVLLCGLVWGQPSVGDAVKEHSAGIICSVVPVKSHLKVGGYPEANVQVRNTGDQSILLVRKLDGSSRAGRYPLVYFDVDGPPEGVHAGGLPRCGTLNPITSEDFVVLQPGGSFDPRGNDVSLGMMVNFLAPGEFKIVFHYSTDEGDPMRWQGAVPSIESDLVEMLRHVPRVAISCSTTVTVDQP
jgi:hypothetical protein